MISDKAADKDKNTIVLYVVIAEECDVTPANFNVAMNFEGLKFVSNDTMLQVV